MVAPSQVSRVACRFVPVMLTPPIPDCTASSMKARSSCAASVIFGADPHQCGSGSGIGLAVTGVDVSVVSAPEGAPDIRLLGSAGV